MTKPIAVQSPPPSLSKSTILRGAEATPSSTGACISHTFLSPAEATSNSRRRYFYAIYFAVLLIHRAARDDHFCAVKYGDDWKTYKAKVPAIFVPGLI